MLLEKVLFLCHLFSVCLRLLRSGVSPFIPQCYSAQMMFGQITCHQSILCACIIFMFWHAISMYKCACLLYLLILCISNNSESVLLICTSAPIRLSLLTHRQLLKLNRRDVQCFLLETVPLNKCLLLQYDRAMLLTGPFVGIVKIDGSHKLSVPANTIA